MLTEKKLIYYKTMIASYINNSVTGPNRRPITLSELIYKLNGELSIQQLSYVLYVLDYELRCKTFPMCICKYYDISGNTYFLIRPISEYNSNIEIMPEVTGYDRFANRFICEDVREYSYSAIADLHYGSEKYNEKNVIVFNDTISNNSIHIVFNCGDYVEGDPALINDDNDVIEINKSFVDNYSFSDDVIIFYTNGNHDESTRRLGINYSKNLIDMYRQDMNYVNNGYINICGTNVAISHDKSVQFDKEHNNKTFNVSYKGHSHFGKVLESGDSFYITVPSLSYEMNPRESQEKFISHPGFIQSSVSYDNHNCIFKSTCYVIDDGKIDTGLSINAKKRASNKGNVSVRTKKIYNTKYLDRTIK